MQCPAPELPDVAVPSPEPGPAPRQGWLLPYENPLDRRLGREFFSLIPAVPGVYRFYGALDELLYVGKAKDLRTRLGSYRRARPDDVSRKVIRMINAARTVRWEECASEAAALLRENEWLRTARPPFNVVNTRPESYVFVGLEFVAAAAVTPGDLELAWQRAMGGPREAVDRVLEDDVIQIRFRTGTELAPLKRRCDRVFGAFKGAGAVRKGLQALLRLLWAAHYPLDGAEPFPLEAPDSPAAALPSPRFAYPISLIAPRPPLEYEISLAPGLSAASRLRWLTLLQRYLRGTSALLIDELAATLLSEQALPPFLARFVQDDLDRLWDLYEAGPHRNRQLMRYVRSCEGRQGRRWRRGEELVAQEKIDDLLVLYRHRPETSPLPTHEVKNEQATVVERQDGGSDGIQPGFGF